MWTCRICHFDTEFDDVELAFVDGRCICVRCFARETGSTLEMPKPLRQALDAVFAEFEATARERDLAR
ncbi:MAG: hypothetical protein AB7R89_04760 [Dehalococcoidia bacterium]